MPRVQEKAPGILPSRSISRGSLISTITTLGSCAALMASAALTVSIAALASSIRDLMPRWMVWGMDCAFVVLSTSAASTARPLPHQFLHRAFEAFDRDRVHALRQQPADDGGGFRIVPVLLRHRIEPNGVRIGARDALQPDRAGLLIDVFERAAA